MFCGAGAIGASTAYLLGRHGAEVVLLKRTGFACAASSNSGGFLALDRCDGTPLEGLARRSFLLTSGSMTTSTAAAAIAG